MSYGLDAKAAEEQIAAIWTPDDGERLVVGRRTAKLRGGGLEGGAENGCTLQVSRL